MSEVSKTFCVLPWTHLATHTDGSVLLCCVAQNEGKLNLNRQSLSDAWNSDYVKSARQKMLKGEEVSACKHCYVEESNGYRSHRLAENGIWVERFGKDFIDRRVAATRPDGSLPDDLVAIDLRIGNTCNLQCVMCRPQDSSKWKALADKLAATIESPVLASEWAYKSRINQKDFEWYQDPAFLKDLESLLPQMREIIIGGGEPMLLDEHRWLIEKCVESGAAKNIQIRYHTNGTTLPEDLFALWKHFKLVEIFVSIDSLGDKNTYMRYPARWEAIEDNLRRLDNCGLDNLRVMILCSVHVLSLFYLPDFADWIERQQFKKVTHGYNGYLHPGVVHYPPYLNVQVYPAELKKVIEERVLAFEKRSKRPSVKIQPVLNLMNQKDESNRLGYTREYFRKLDLARSTDFAQVFPELNEYLHVY